MAEALAWISTALLIINLLILLVLITRRHGGGAEGVQERFDALERLTERTERGLREDLAKHREEYAGGARGLREELSKALRGFSDAHEHATRQLREAVEARLTAIQKDNADKLEQMRATVDDKLHQTLETRLGEAFKLVSERLEQVHVGLGEMKSLAAGVGDLKRVLTNVKTRGAWGEVQLGNLLEELFTADQYTVNATTREDADERVEFAIRLPGRDGAGDSVLLPIDAKFPQEDYQRLLDAQDRGDAAAVADAASALEARVRQEARKIRDKYINPPVTTDFAILFLPTEGLFAEVLRRPGLHDGVLQSHRVFIAGPTTLAATLTCLQLGFRTLAIEKRSSEVWEVLGAVKTEFGKFAEVLDKVHKKLQEAGNTIEDAQKRSRVMSRKLKAVEALPDAQAGRLLGAADSPADSTGSESGEADDAGPEEPARARR